MLVSRNVVVAAELFMPTEIGEHWLVSNGVFEKAYGNRVCTEMVSQYSSSHIDVMIMKQSATFTFKPTAVNDDALQSVRRFIENVPDPKFLAIGFNFLYHLDVSGDVRTLSRRFRFQPDCDGIHHEGTTWGMFAVTPFLEGSMLRTQVIPDFQDNNLTSNPSKLVADLNVHFSGRDKNSLLKSLQHYTECSNRVCDIQSRLLNTGSN